MQITRIRPGALSGAQLDSLVAEVVAFDARENAASGLGPDFGPLPTQVRQALRASTRYTARELWVGRLGEEIVAKGTAHLGLVDNTDQAEVWLAVDPARRRQGLGSALLARMEADLTGSGRTRLLSFNEVSVEECTAARRQAHLAAASGVGSPSLGVPSVAFLARHGFVLEQLERCSAARTAIAAGIDVGDLHPDYSIVTWSGATPEEHLAGMAVLHQRMSTDTPGAQRLSEEERWDEERVRELDAERARSGERMHTALALHGDAAAGFTEVAESLDRPEAGWQGATIVAKEHRGHRLGAHLKIANHTTLAAATGVRRVYTWNAAENSWMLAINDLAGFATHAWTGVWQKRLA